MDPYMDENDLIELPQDDQAVDNYRKYPYGMSGNNYTNLNGRGNKINRFYHKLKPYYVKQDPSDCTLIFESRFESGNLQLAHKVCDTEYNLIL